MPCAALSAQKPPVADITLECKFQVSSRDRRLFTLFDSNALTYWKSEAKEENYIQFSKPEGVATLSLLWRKLPSELKISWQQDGQSHVLRVFQNIPDAEFPIPYAIVLPESAGVYRLSTANEELFLLEVRVHKGLAENFFANQGYPDAPTGIEAGLNYLKPVLRNEKPNPKIRQMQTRLKEMNYYAGPADGLFQSSTYIALLQFQRLNGLYPSGTLEAATACMLENPAALAAEPVNQGEKLPRTASAFVAYAREQAGMGYVHGAVGQICTPSLRGAAAKLYPEYSGLIEGYASLWDGMPAFDCIGLVKGFLAASEGDFPASWHVNVTGAVRRWMIAIEPIATMPREPGLLLLQEDPDSPGSFMHIGVYAGEGECIHARGHRYGVVQEPMPQLWTHWACPIWLKYDMPEEKKLPWPGYMAAGTRVIVDSDDGTAINLYSEPKKSSSYFTGVQIKNYTELRIEAVPDEHYWRIVTVKNSKGESITGYVYAKDLSLLR